MQCVFFFIKSTIYIKENRAKHNKWNPADWWLRVNTAVTITAFQFESKCNQNEDFSEGLNGHYPDRNLIGCNKTQFPLLMVEIKQKYVTNFINIMVLLHFGS